ncbi:hypothetical protein [Ethanoligenens sp.]|uniref:hypothetical protein n=1 Tax=Ethanoligenens sp. TaxID=2099655 RepID=UPI0039ECC190
MRIIMGKVHQDRAVHPRQVTVPGRAHRAIPAKPAQHSKKQRSGNAVFVLLGAAFIATIAAGVHEGMIARLSGTTQKAAVLSAQMSYPHGGQTVAAREMNKLQGIFTGTAQQKSQSAASESKQVEKKETASGK